MNKLYVDVRAIQNNLQEIIKLTQPRNIKLFVIAKANFYGFGYPLLSYLIKYIDGIVFSQEVAEEMPVWDKEAVKLIYRIHNKLSLEQNSMEINEQVFFYLMRIINMPPSIKAKCYLRVDPFLGMHGLTLDELKEVRLLKEYYGLFLYLNEEISEKEQPILNEIVSLAEENGLHLNVGGSAILQHLDILPRKNTEVRLLRKILFSRNSYSTMFLCCDVLTRKEFRGVSKSDLSIDIGFKSSRKTFCRGHLCLLSVGYSECKFFPLFYQKELSFKINGTKYQLAVYPGMNTSWVWGEEDTCNLNDTACIFTDYCEVQEICSNLDIDIDEFYTSFSDGILRKYLQ